MIRTVDRRYPNLDGMRALAVGMVFVSHFFYAAHLRGPLRFAAAFFGDGELGVSIFFVISGFLITALLRREHARNGGIDLRAFYLRRVRRIFPALYVYLIVVALLGTFDLVDLPWPDWWSAACFARDYIVPTHAWTVAHLWSVGAEEQFYLIWPFVLARASRTRALTIALSIVAVEPFVRLGTYAAFPHARELIPHMLHTRADMLMLGCALAVANEAPGFPSIARRVFGPAVLGGAALIVFVVTPLGDAFARGKYELLGGDLATGFAIVTLLAWIMSDGVSSRAGRALSHPAIVRLGIISYSFYLWRQLVLLPGGRAPLWQFPVDFGVVIVLAEASYRFVERPLLAHAASHAAPGIVDTPGGA